jgi:hypothetical protein
MSHQPEPPATVANDAAGERPGRDPAEGATAPAPRLTERQKLILEEMSALGAVGSNKKTKRNEIAQRIDKNKTGADLARDFGALKEAQYTDSDAGPDGGVWLTGKGKAKAEELRQEKEE